MLNLAKLDTKEITAEEVRSDYLLFESSSSEYRYQMAEDHEFYLGSQLTKSQKNYLLSVGQPPEANNKIFTGLTKMNISIRIIPNFI